MDKIFYIISTLMLFIFSMIIKKNNEKRNFIVAFFVNTVIFTCYNMVVCFVLNYLKIDATLNILMIPNYIMSILLGFKVFKDKQIQKYYFKLKDLIAILILTFICLTIAYLNYGFPPSISFICTDASNHYEMVLNYCENGKLGVSQFGAYTNYGIIFMLFLDMIGKFNGYILFLILETIKLVYSGILFYLLLSKFIKNKISYIIGIVLSIIYMIAYPLNGVLSGFVYLQMAVNIINTILIVILNEKELNSKEKYISLSLLLIGVMCTYYILVPPVYIVIFIYELKNLKENKLKTLINLITLFVLPCLMGIIIHLIPILTKNDLSAIRAMNSGGVKQAYIFTNYYSGFLFFIPTTLIYMIEKIKNKKWDFLFMLAIINILYVILSIILNKYGIIEKYYIMKIYYMLWLTIVSISSIECMKILNNKIDWFYKMSLIIVITIYTMGIILNCIMLKGRIKMFEREKETINSMYNIYLINKSTILHETSEIVALNDNLKIINELYKKLEKQDHVIFVGEWIKNTWIKELMNDVENYHGGDNILENLLKTNELDKILEENNVYIICYKSLWVKYYKTDYIQQIRNKMNIYQETENIVIFNNR